VFQTWVKGVWSESLVKNVQNKETFNSTTSNGTVIAWVFSFAVDLNLFWYGSDNGNGIIIVGEWVARVIVFIGGVHHYTGVTVVEDFTVLIHVVLGFSGAFSVVFLEVTPASVVPDFVESGVDRVVDVDYVSLVDIGVVC